MGNRDTEGEAEAHPVDSPPVRGGRELAALRWGAAFGVAGAVVLMALTFVFALLLGAVVDLTSGVTGQDLGELDRWALTRQAAAGPITCIAVSSGLAWVIARSPGTTVRPWGIGLLSGIVGVLAGWAALQFTVF
jgi:hypothetical protein